MKIKKLYSSSPQEDTKMKAIKKAVLAKVDYRFPETERVRLYQLLDPETKHVLPRTDATVIMETAIKETEQRHITLPFPIFANRSGS